jgi:F-type H+-transporting ATPase subunit a
VAYCVNTVINFSSNLIYTNGLKIGLINLLDGIKMLILSPLEQFQIVPLISLKFEELDFSFTNSLLVSLISLIFFSSIVYFMSSKKNSSNESSFYFVPNSWQTLFELIYDVVSQQLFDLVSVRSEKYFPFISVLFIYILFHNLIGLIPYSFTTTSHLIVTFVLSFSTFVGINVICFKKHKISMFSLFLPSNSTFFLALVLTPIEFVSYVFKPVSLGVRLFINLMAGHSLLKIIVGFSWSMLLLENTISFGFILPLILLITLMALELGVALIQTYVFVTLICIYLNEGEILH